MGSNGQVASREIAYRVVEAIPDGWWTSYGALGALLSTRGYQAIGQWIRGPSAPRKAYRVLQSRGTISPGFVWNAANSDRARRREDVRKVLEAEGVPFDSNGRAEHDRFLDAEQLSLLIHAIEPVAERRVHGPASSQF